MPLPKDKTAKELGFKVGDRFRVVDDQHSVFSRGTIVTLILDDESSSPKFSGGSGGAYCSFWRLEPLDRAKAPSPYKFKVGDRVRLKSTNGQGARYAYGTVGMTGEISQVGLIGSSRDVEAILGGTREVFCSEDLELIHRPCPDHSPGLCCCDSSQIDREPSNTPSPSIPPVGTRIRIIQRYRGWQPIDSQIDHASRGMAVTVGQPIESAPKDKGAFHVDTDDGNKIIMSNCDHYEILDRPPQHPNCKPAMTFDIGLAPQFLISPSQKAQPQGVSIMSRLTTLAKKAFDKPTKTLIQARVLNDDLSINDGEFILAVLVDLNKDALVKAAQERLDEEKAESK